ncbi:MAG: 50S ribosomal protein L29, partial [Planctomycetes bacterium]|nr:50S ribosomal protein L29 [Planctomycetota bacterium]
MKISEIRDLKTEELHAELDRLRRHLFDLRSQAVTENLQDPSMLTK